MQTRTVGLDTFSLRPTPSVCCHQHIPPQTSGRSAARGSGELAGGLAAGRRIGRSLKWHHERKGWALRAGQDDKDKKFSNADRETILVILDACEDLIRGARDFVEKLEPKDVKENLLPDRLVKFLTKPSDDMRDFFPEALEKVREAKAKIVAGEIVDFNQLAYEIQAAVPYDPTWSAWTRAFGYAVGIFTIGWLFSLVGIDGWARWNLPNGGMLTWLQWTAPHVLVSVLFWQNFLSDRFPSLKAYKLAQANCQTEEMSIAFVNRASSFDLAVEAFFLSFNLVFRDQGLYLNCIASGFAVPPPETSMQGAMGGLAVQQTLPKVFRIPLEIGSVGLLTSLGSVLRDPTISPFSIQSSVDTGDTSAPAPTPLRQSTSVEELELLTSKEITTNRTWITAILFLAQGVYLTTETIATNSLIAPIATNAISLFVFLKAVQEMKATPPAPKPQEP